MSPSYKGRIVGQANYTMRDYLHEIIPIESIPLNVKLSNGMEVNLRDRFLNFVRGSEKPLNGYYLKDVLLWIEWEGITNLTEYCNL